MSKTTRKFNIGIDLAQDSFDVSLAPEHPDISRWRELPHTTIPFRPESPEGIAQLTEWFRKCAKPSQCERIVVESTGQISRRFVHALQGHGFPSPVIMNPKRTKSFSESIGMRDKTDRVDAAALALFAATHAPKPKPQRSPTEEQLRDLTRLRESYLADLTAWKNRLGETLGPHTRNHIEKTIRHLEKEIEKIRHDIDRKMAEDEKLASQAKAIVTIKGLKWVASTTLTTELGHLCNYTRNELTAAAGIFPKQFDSGKSVHKRPRLAKGGGTHVRRVLYMCATSLFHSKGPMRDYIEAMRRRGINDSCIRGAVMRKLLLIARAVVKNDGRYLPEKICHQTSV